MKKKLAALFALSALPMFAAEGDTTVSSLWQALGLNFGTKMTEVFTALAVPVGVVVTVVMVMAVFWFCLRMARNAINKRQSI